MNKKPDKMIVDGRVYEINERHLKKMEVNKLERKNVRSRVALGWNLEDAIDAPLGMTKKEYQLFKLDSAYKEQEELDAITKKRKQEKLKDDCQRREEMLAKYRVRSKYFGNLADNNLIATIKTDCYGRVQRGQQNEDKRFEN